MSDVSHETPKPNSDTPSGKNKRSSFYIYLVILFGAAFLMLLLAYFVQQRNSESAISDLRDSMNLSRVQLMEQIKTLEGEKQGLEAQIAELEAQQAELQQQKDELEEDSFWLEKDLRTQLTSWTALWYLEQNFRDEDYEACTLFFQNATTSNYYVTPAEAAERAEEIYNHLLEQGLLTEDIPLPVVFTAE